MIKSSYTGDISLTTNEYFDFDVIFKNGQPEMTDFIDTLVLLYTFGIDSYYNDIVSKKSERMNSKFPSFVDSANVSNESLANGRIYLLESLQPLLSEKIASKISIDGEILSVYGMRWDIDIERFDSKNSKYSIFWEKGFLKLESKNNGIN